MRSIGDAPTGEGLAGYADQHPVVSSPEVPGETCTTVVGEHNRDDAEGARSCDRELTGHENAVETEADDHVALNHDTFVLFMNDGSMVFSDDPGVTLVVKIVGGVPSVQSFVNSPARMVDLLLASQTVFGNYTQALNDKFIKLQVDPTQPGATGSE